MRSLVCHYLISSISCGIALLKCLSLAPPNLSTCQASIEFVSDPQALINNMQVVLYKII